MRYEKSVRVTRRIPWQWKCQDSYRTWHDSVDDVGWAESQAEVIAMANEHATRWHNPENPTRVCGVDMNGHGNCAEHEGHQGNHDGILHYADDYTEIPGVLMVHFDEYGRYLDED